MAMIAVFVVIVEVGGDPSRTYVSVGMASKVEDGSLPQVSFRNVVVQD